MNNKNNNDRFYSLNNYLKETFGHKIYKVSLDGGFTCPNRDGTISSKGCLFCSDRGSGEFTGERGNSITKQIEEQLEFISGKNENNNVIAYFQNFTNTYAPIEYLKKIYYEALSHEKVMGIAIATRPDCLNDEVLNLLSEINNKFFLWIELGLQTAKNNTAEIINRGYKTSCYIEACEKLNSRNIKFVTHMIVGLPFETKEDIINTAQLINNVNSWGIKIHLLYILKNSPLEKYYNEYKFKVFEKDEYTDIVIEIISILNPNIVVHRLTGDAKKEDLFLPLWSTDKRGVLNDIQKKLKSRNIYQGKEYK
ncbi:TIGR01212 family radical SAM protein [Fusobacterium perfoetens]|uniref:TIGR01212 family radical SAM protein n=1 Tax=Fusobacterium perfoetens TaxID=852 RepID=UPI001EECF0B4|nr:TIGR01212 family radical SAM protein [Fusobacterium perfoetens]MCF2625227.1 TIGR01212 family radical SAM protein [Fusobacterium perfoetens]